MPDNNQNKEIVELVVARLQQLPSNKDISIGSFGEYSKDEIIQHVKASDEIGKKMIDIELSFLRMMKNGNAFYEQYSSGNHA